jgi:hypothetical protein
LLAWTAGCASLVPIEEDQTITLAPDEGVLIVDIVSNIHLDWLRSESLRIDSISPGHTVRLYIAPEGEYEWSTARGRLGPYGTRYNFHDDPSLHFTVKAGHINYPGRLVFRDRFGSNYFEARTINRSAEIANLLESTWPRLLASYPLQYSGFIRDDFLTEYQKLLGARSDPSGGATVPGSSESGSQ